MTIEQAVSLLKNCKDSVVMDSEFEMAYDMAIQSLEREKEVGQWERIPYSMTDYGRRCSLCHFKVGNTTNYCPDCGAKMERRTNDNRRTIKQS